jgi:hypothetical protein
MFLEIANDCACAAMRRERGSAGARPHGRSQSGMNAVYQAKELTPKPNQNQLRPRMTVVLAKQNV